MKINSEKEVWNVDLCLGLEKLSFSQMCIFQFCFSSWGAAKEPSKMGNDPAITSYVILGHRYCHIQIALNLINGLSSISLPFLPVQLIQFELPQNLHHELLCTIWFFYICCSRHSNESASLKIQRVNRAGASIATQLNVESIEFSSECFVLQ